LADALLATDRLWRHNVVDGRGDEECKGVRRGASFIEVERLVEVTLHHHVEQISTGSWV
jgi:hypothetical protein